MDISAHNRSDEKWKNIQEKFREQREILIVRRRLLSIRYKLVYIRLKHGKRLGMQLKWIWTNDTCDSTKLSQPMKQIADQQHIEPIQSFVIGYFQ